jgi:lysozyme family protein
VRAAVVALLCAIGLGCAVDSADRSTVPIESLGSTPLADLPPYQQEALWKECSMFEPFGGGWTSCVRFHKTQLVSTDPLEGLPSFQSDALMRECSMYVAYGGGWTLCIQSHRSQLVSTDPLQGLTPEQRAAAMRECSMYVTYGGGWTLCAQAQRSQITGEDFPAAAPAPTYGCAENGSCYGDTSAATGAPKTVHVDGYTRKDGTYVREHYRSAPRSR